MPTQRVVFIFAMACGVLLLFAPLTPRTTWVGLAFNEIGGGGGGMRHSAGWEWFTPLFGIVAMAGLVFGRWARPAVIASAVGAALAVVAFLATGLVAGGHWWDGVTGSLAVGGMVTYPAPAAPFFAVVAALGAASALLLALGWLRSPKRTALA